MKKEEIKKASFLLDQIRYECASLENLKRKEINSEYKRNSTITKVIIQNNRHNSYAKRCSGGCWYCFADSDPVSKRRETRPSIAIEEAKKIITKLQNNGIENFQFNGEDYSGPQKLDS